MFEYPMWDGASYSVIYIKKSGTWSFWNYRTATKQALLFTILYYLQCEENIIKSNTGGCFQRSRTFGQMLVDNWNKCSYSLGFNVNIQPFHQFSSANTIKSTFQCMLSLIIHHFQGLLCPPPYKLSMDQGPSCLTSPKERQAKCPLKDLWSKQLSEPESQSYCISKPKR